MPTKTKERERQPLGARSRRARVPVGRPGRQAPANKVETLLSQRQLSPSQTERLNRLRDAARQLAAEGGYAAVTMRAVAERAGVGLATVYRYFSSKDHLIADVHAMKSVELIDSLHASPPAGQTAVERMAEVFGRALGVAAENLKLASAGVSAITSGDELAASPDYWRKMVMGPYLDIALGDEDVGDRAELGEILGHIFFSLMVGMATGRKSLQECRRVMDRAVHLILD